MYGQKLIAIALLFSASWGFAFSSAQRHTSESWQQARERNAVKTISNLEIQSQTSALKMSKRLDQWDHSKVNEVSNMEELNRIFAFVRDTKFVKNMRNPVTERRLSWLYPDDGCFVRAELAVDYVQEQKMPTASKVFIFGDLVAKTDNHPHGEVSWWYHVAPLYRVGNDLYVLDPAIEPHRPLHIQEWKTAVTARYPADKFSICNTHTLDPDSDCLNPKQSPLSTLIYWQRGFLEMEWLRVQDLGRSPEKELGDLPPWR